MRAVLDLTVEAIQCLLPNILVGDVVACFMNVKFIIMAIRAVAVRV
ncbi:MAG: hypothetical protein NVS4B7_14500 [Ktedonobacteraceae bacterium]